MPSEEKLIRIVFKLLAGTETKEQIAQHVWRTVLQADIHPAELGVDGALLKLGLAHRARAGELDDFGESLDSGAIVYHMEESE